jgi:Fe-S-cluster-containing hydrogenase component 2
VNALDAAARLLSSGDELLVTHFERCLHQISVEADCEACLQTCPTEAITKGDTLIFDKAQCTSCLACVIACPTGVFTTKSQLSGLLRCAAYSPTAEVELLCEFHPSPSGSQVGNPVVRVHGCLAGLGVGTYLCLLEAGVSKITLRCEACSSCSMGSLYEMIEKEVNETFGLLNGDGEAPLVVHRQLKEITPDEAGPLWNADNPPISRRELFQLGTRKGIQLIIDALSEQLDASGKSVGADRLHLNAVLPRLSAAQRIRADAVLEPFGYAAVALSDECTACAACARICPTGALAFQERDERFRLTFKPELCIACELCNKVCFLKAIELVRNLTAWHFAKSSTTITLLEGERKKCYRCGEWYFARENTNLCPVCSFRKQNPFSSMLPPGINLHPPGGEVQS